MGWLVRAPPQVQLKNELEVEYYDAKPFRLALPRFYVLADLDSDCREVEEGAGNGN